MDTIGHKVSSIDKHWDKNNHHVTTHIEYEHAHPATKSWESTLPLEQHNTHTTIEATTIYHHHESGDRQ